MRCHMQSVVLKRTDLYYRRAVSRGSPDSPKTFVSRSCSDSLNDPNLNRIISFIKTLRAHTLLAVLILVAALPTMAAITESQRAAINAAPGTKGSYSESEDAYKVSFPRADVKVTIGGRPMHPFLGLTSWAAFTPDAHGY